MNVISEQEERELTAHLKRAHGADFYWRHQKWLFGFLTGIAVSLVGLFIVVQRPQGDGIFYEECRASQCVIKAHLPWSPVPDPIVFRGPFAPRAIPGTEGRGGNGRPLLQMGAPELANALNNLPGYGPYFNPKLEIPRGR